MIGATPGQNVPPLPEVRGSLGREPGLGRKLWLRAGGGAQWLFQPQDEEDLARFLADCPEDVPVTVIGAGSNLIVRDGGIGGVVIRLGPAFSTMSTDADGLRVGAGALAPKVSLEAGRRSLSGLEFLLGIPGTIGGCVRMNAGAQGGEMRDIVRRITAFDRSGKRQDVPCRRSDFTYRRSRFPKDWIITQARITARAGDGDVIAARMEAVRAYRRSTQPGGRPTGGSTFLNPPGEKAWSLIERSGCRGLRRGGAMVSPDHCNFLVNLGRARGEDFENLGEEVRRRVHEHTGITLEWEIIRVGEKLGEAS